MKTSHTIYTSFAKRLVVVLALLTLGVTSAWATEYEEMLVLDVAKNAPTGSTTTAMEADAILSYLENASETKNEIKSVTDVSGKVYKGKGTSGDGIPQACLKIGKASEAAGFTFTIADTFDDVSKVTIIGYGWKTSTAVSVNESAGQTPTSAATEVSFDYILASPTKTIKIYVGKSAFCATQIILYKEAASKCAYTVTFNSNYGTNSTYSQEFTCDVAQNLTANSFSRTGYTFARWNTKANGTGTSYTNQASVSNLAANGETITLFAQWTAKTSTISFDQNGGEGGQTATVTATYDQPMPTPITLPTRYGHTFGGYYDGEGSTGTQYYTAEGTSAKTWNKTSASATLYAKWTEKELTNYRTTCTEPCEQLGAATGLSVQTDYVENDETYVKFSWTPANNTKDHATKQVICIGKVGEEKKCTDLDGNQVWSGDLLSKLTPGEYEWTIQAIGYGETYCDGEVISGPNFTIEEPLTDNCRWVEIALEDITPEDEIVVTMGDDKTVYALGTEKITNSPKSQAITIASGMIDINQDFDYSKYTWSISAVTDGYTLQPYGTTDTYLYGLTSYISIGNNNTNNIFTIFTSPENGNKCFMYTIGYTPYYLGHGKEDGQTAWKRVTDSDKLLKSNTLKFYKKTCLPANKFWIDYELANVTCTNTPPHSQIDQTGEDLFLEFSANEGYKLPASISISIGNNILPEDNDVYIWDSETGELFISAAQVTDNITITIEGCERLATPTNLSVTNITSTSARLSWNAVTNADEYRICVMDGETQLDELTTTETYVNVMNLKKNSFYTWDVVAEANDYCESLATAWIEFRTLDVYTVTFNTDGGTPIDPQTIDHGSKATKPANPTKTGYTFAGWYTEADTEFNFNTPITSATDLYAKWNANQYTITFRQQWGNGGTETATVHFDNNDFSVSPIIVPTRNGYTFGGYYTAESGAGTQLIDVSGAWLNAPTYIEGGKWVYADNLTLYAKWTQNFTITWMANGQLYHTQTAMMGTAIAKPDDPKANELACDDKVFVGWLDETISGSTNEEPTFVTDFGTIQANETYYAVFAKLTGTPSNDYNKITNINDLTDGEYVIAYSYDGGTQVVLKNTTKDAKYMNASALAPSSNKYTSPSAEYIWQLQKQDDGSYYMYNSSVNKFLYATTSALQLSDNPTKYNISYDNTYSHWKIKLSDNASYYMHGYVSGSSYDFRVSTSGSGNKYRVYLYKNASTAVYSDYVTTCVEIPTPHWEGAEIDNANIAVDCGTISFKSNASKITFDKNYDLTYPITLTASEGFLLSTNKQNDIYEQSVTVTPVQSGDNKGKITQSVYVRADATGKNTNFDGTITISGDQLTADQILEVHAVVDCPQYTLTFNDCGDTKTISNFAGTSVEEMEPWAETCSEPFQYVFDGWAKEPVTNGTEEYDKVDFSTFTMPNNNTTMLYAVYRYAEEGGEPVNGYVKVTEALTDWSGDYVIVDDENLFAIKNAYRENANSNKTLAGETVTIENGKVVSPSANIVWTFSKNGDGYTMFNADANIYAGIGTHSRAAVLSEIIDDENNIKIIFDDATDIAKVSGIKNNRCFQYYVTNDEIKEWRTYDSNQSQYNTGYLYRLSNKTIRYTSSLVCGSIEAENAIVTSTVGQTVKVYVPITLNYSEAASITGTSDNEAFTVVTKNDVAVGESNIEVHYKPTAYINTTNQEETATITLTTSNGATTTFNVTGRCLPETFAIVAKVGNVWYALPSQGLNSGTTPVGYLVEVDNNDNPTAVTAVPENADWSLRQVLNDRFTANGENLVFVNAENKTLYASKENANIQTFAEYTNYAAKNPDRYEWVPTTTDLTNYTLKNVGRDKNLSINTNATFGTHASNIVSNNLRFLPITGRYTPAALQVVEWKENSVVIMYNGDPAQTASVSVNGGEAQTTTLSAPQSQRDIAVYELAADGLAANPTQRLSITIGAEKVILSIPYIVSGTQNDYDLLPGSSVSAKREAAKIADLIVLNAATLTAEGSKSDPYKFRNVTIYGGGSLVIPADKGFGANTLTMRVGGVENRQYKNLYPQLQLKGTLTNTSGQINLDYLTTNDFYYPLSVPYSVTIADIQYPVDIYGANVKADNKGSFQFKYYDGAERAAGRTGWIVLDESQNSTLNPNTGYAIWGIPKKVKVNGGESTRQKFGIHRLPLKQTAANIMTSEQQSHSATINVCNGSKRDSDNGWNYLGNPYLSHYGNFTTADKVMKLGKLVWDEAQGAWLPTETEQRYVVFTNDCQNYTAELASTTAIPAFSAFFIQADQGGAINFTSPNVATPQSLAARHSEEETKEITTGVILSGEKHSDRTGLLIADQFTQAYEFNADLSKFDNQDMNLYTISSCGKLAFMAINEDLAKQTIPLGYSVSTDGMYSIGFDEQRYSRNDIYALYLIDYDRNETTNLLHMDYNFYSETGAHAERFALQVAFAPKTATDVEYTQVGDVLVSREGNTLRLDNLPSDATVTIYDAVGHLIEQHSSSQHLQVDLPTGYYLLHVANKQNSVVIDTFIP